MEEGIVAYPFSPAPTPAHAKTYPSSDREETNFWAREGEGRIMKAVQANNREGRKSSADNQKQRDPSSSFFPFLSLSYFREWPLLCSYLPSLCMALSHFLDSISPFSVALEVGGGKTGGDGGVSTSGRGCPAEHGQISQGIPVQVYVDP